MKCLVCQFIGYHVFITYIEINLAPECIYAVCFALSNHLFTYVTLWATIVQSLMYVCFHTFLLQQAHQIEVLKEHIEDEIKQHEKLIKQHQDEIERHKKKIRDLKEH